MYCGEDLSTVDKAVAPHNCTVEKTGPVAAVTGTRLQPSDSDCMHVDKAVTL